MVYLTRKNVRTHIKCPQTPNFIKIDGEYKSLGLLSDDDLKIVADEWKEHLLTKAKKQRSNRGSE